MVGEMHRDQILKNMDKVYYKLEIYDRKKKQMGLDKNENERFCNLLVDYLELKMRLCDNIFNEYILNEIIDDKCDDILESLSENINWSGELLISQSEMDAVKNQYLYLTNNLLVIQNIVNLYEILNRNLLKFYNDTNDKSGFEEISELLSNDKSSNFSIITDFLKFKFTTLFLVLELDKEDIK
jgi:regulator of sigma D